MRQHYRLKSLFRSHADSKERARRQYRACTPTVRHWRTQSRKGLCYSGPTTLNWFPGGACSTRASGRDWLEKHTELVCGWRRWRRVSASEASTRRLHELNYRQTVPVDQLLVTVQPVSSTDIRDSDDSSSRLKAFGSIPSGGDSRRMILQLFQSHLEQHFEFSSSISTCLFLMTAVKLL